MGTDTPADEHTNSMNDLRRRLSNISDRLAEQYRVNSGRHRNRSLTFTVGSSGCDWGLYWYEIDETNLLEPVRLTSMAMLSDDQALDACSELGFVLRCLVAAQEKFNTRKVSAEKHLSTFIDTLEAQPYSEEPS